MIRTGYGRGYNLGVFGSIFGHNVTQNLPVLAIQSDQPAQNFDAVFTLAKGPRAINPATILASQPKGPERTSDAAEWRDVVRDYRTRSDFPLSTPGTSRSSGRLGQSMSFEVAYVGTKGTHVFAGTGGDYDPNQADINGFGTLTTNQRKPFFQKFGWSQNLRYYGSDASNNYHSLQTRFDKRFSQRAVRRCPTTHGRRTSTTTAPTIRETRSLRADASSNNRAHVFFLSSLYELPVGQGQAVSCQQRAEGRRSDSRRMAGERNI